MRTQRDLQPGRLWRKKAGKAAVVYREGLPEPLHGNWEPSSSLCSSEASGSLSHSTSALGLLENLRCNDFS